MKLPTYFLVTGLIALISLPTFFPGLFPQEDDDQDSPLVSLGVNANDEVLESSGLAYSSHVENAIWTLNDSGHPAEMLLLKTDGKLLAKVRLRGTSNIDWEAMADFEIDDRSYLLVADVGDNLVNRRTCQLFLLPEPDLSSELKQTKPEIKLPIEIETTPTRLEFSYQDGPKNCEAVAVDVVGKQIWLVEKIYYDAKQKVPPGVYVLPLLFERTLKPLVAKRIADFPPRNVTGMAFSPDGKRLIIRNYIDAHLYSRTGHDTWESIISKTKPATVVLPLQRQGEAICFTPDSKSVILTSELKRQPIWQVDLGRYFDPPADQPKPSPTEK